MKKQKKKKKYRQAKKSTFKLIHLVWLVLFLGLFAWGFGSNPAGSGFTSPTEKGVLK